MRKLFLIGLLLVLIGSACRGRPSPPLPIIQDQSALDSDYRPTAVVEWNEAALAAVRAGQPQPTVVTRQLFIVHAAMYDAWTRYDDSATSLYLNTTRRPASEHNDINRREAIAFAAYGVLTHYFADYAAHTAAFDVLMAAQGYRPAKNTVPFSPADIGRRAAAAAIDARRHDGANEPIGYAERPSPRFPELYQPQNDPHGVDHLNQDREFNPNAWHPLYIPNGTFRDRLGFPAVNLDDNKTYGVQSFLTPHWGAVNPFALQAGSQLRPPPPPYLDDMTPYTDALGVTTTGDAAYRQQFAAVLAISGKLSDEQKVIAEYWADGPRSETPPGHWNALAHGIAYRDRHTLEDDVKLFMVLNCALLDGAIAAWDAKRTYDYVRPQTAIRYLYDGKMVEAWGGPDQGTQLIPGETWRPYQDLQFVTPAFPEYVSGHSVFSAAAAEVLTRFAGTDRFYDGQTRLPEDFNADGQADMLGEHIVYPEGNVFESSPSQKVILRWPTLKDAADEAGLSRLYGGIHIQDGDLRGRELGQQIGALAFEKVGEYWEGKR